ncbi:MAG: hypothetical protein LKE46_09635 [Clostridium sp.]|jgi:hypothetical protein|uniref:hypothetical protein n=2 Tax=Clostridium sp. TaxID=1506 RepID=UPI0025BBDD44|nr:hypothetical protein [Clostridium sp.]MCH3964524.1 hypothetical protein [Clostridium sp.]MCI1714995.1 hypothetical protein [Clostridium sp.]MCI1799257.1 hypothetical protein [Clostridium sp.]MCI1813178.1 hypothetical protein [Clostridium sp.]MCI1870069.1 hypothetical protein [Clostridium sp.]
MLQELKAIIPPEGVPDKVCFLIVGQPILEYPSYPDWLSYENDKLLKLEIPRLGKSDVIELYKKEITSISKEYTESVIRLIMDIFEGNTLPVIYAIYEAKQCKSIEELGLRLREKNLSSGLMAYYEYTWKSALELIPSVLFVDYLLAGAIGLINRKLSSELLASIYDDANIQERVWKSVLRKLYPVLIEEQDGFRILHNDFRIYLEKYLRKSPKEMKEIAYKIANFYTSRSDDFLSKHEIVFRMLKLAEKEDKFIDVFTAQYVMEAIALSRPIIEIEDQLELTIKSLTKVSDLRKINSFSCAISTFYQFKQSMQWLDKDYQGTIKLPSVLQSESKVKSKDLLTKYDLNDVLNEVLWLINENEISRAKSIMDRWFSTYSPENIFDLLRSNNEIEIKDGRYIFEHSIGPILEKWGEVCQHTGINFKKEKIDDNIPDYYKKAKALFYRGWLKEGELFCDEESLARTLSSLRIHYSRDMEDFVLSLIDKNKIEHAKILLDNFYSRNNGSKMFILRCLLWVILSGDSVRFNKWIKDIKEQEFDYIKDEYFDLTKDSFEGYVIISFILAYLHKNFDYIINKVLNSYREGKSSKREKIAIMDLVTVSSYLGDLIRKFKGGLQLNNSEHNEFESIFRVLVNDDNPIGRHEVGGFEIEKLLVRVFMFINNEVSNYFDSVLYKVIKEQVVKLDYSKNIDVYWNYLKDKNEIKLLDDLFEHWVGDNGEIWKSEISDMYDIGEKFIFLGGLVKWSSRIEKVREKLNRKSIGYTGRKEYSLYMPLRWFETLTNYSNNHWEDIGVELLNVSENASKLGDNRAGVFINASIASSAGKMGYGNLWRFASLQEEWDKDWLYTVYDGLISLLEVAEISNNELKNIWRVSAAIFKINKYSNKYDSSNNIKKVYIHDLRTCILLVGKKFGYKDLDNSLKEIAEEEYLADKGTYDYRLPDRWFEDKNKFKRDLLELNEKIESMSCEEAVMYVINDYNEQRNKDEMDNNFRWDYISEIVKKYDGKLNIDNHILPLLDTLLQRKYKYSWDFDGADRAYEAVFTFLDDKQILKVLSRIVEDYKSEEDNNVRLSSIKSNLEYFSYFYYKNLSEEDIETGLAEILKTHILWFTGNNVIEYRRGFGFNGETINEPGSWNEFCYDLLDKFLLSKMADSIKQIEEIKDIKQDLEI